MSSVLFVIPTLFTAPRSVNRCAKRIHANMRNFDIEYKICVVVNSRSDKFDKYSFSSPVEKLCGHRQFNISRALNVAVKEFPDYEFFCFYDEGMEISHTSWLDHSIRLLKSHEGAGLIGCRPHSSFDFFRNEVSRSPSIYEVLWSDGVLLTKMSTITAFGGFDEDYFAECELQDFGYRLHQSGFTNYYWHKLADSHKLVKFEKKHSDKHELLRLRASSRALFHQRWSEFEKRYGFQTIKEFS